MMGLPGSLAVLLLAMCSVEAEVLSVPSVFCDKTNELNQTIYDFSHPDIWGMRNVSFSQYAGKQEPGTNATEILNGIRHVRPGNNFQPSFPLFAKIEVNGETESPLFSFIKSQCPSTRDGHSQKERLLYNPLKNTDIRWNFEKFLVTKNGQPYKRYDPSFNPLDMHEDIKLLLEMKAHEPFSINPGHKKIDYKPVHPSARSRSSDDNHRRPAAVVIWCITALLLATK